MCGMGLGLGLGEVCEGEDCVWGEELYVGLGCNVRGL